MFGSPSKLECELLGDSGDAIKKLRRQYSAKTLRLMIVMLSMDMNRKWLVALAAVAMVFSGLPVGAQDNSSDSNKRGSTRTSRTSLFKSSRTNDAKNTKESDAKRNQKDADKTREKKSNQPGSKGAKPAAKTDEKTVKGKPGPAAKSGGEGARPTTTVEFKMKADPSANLLYVESISVAPTMNIVVEQGAGFATRTVYRNARKSRFTSVDVALRYEPSVVGLTGIDDSEIAPLLKQPAIAKVDAQKGIFAYHAEFSQPQERDLTALFKLKWKALKPSEHSPLVFLNTEDYPSRVMNGEENVLLRSSDSEDFTGDLASSGLVDAAISVTPNRETLLEMEDAGYGAVTGMALAREISEGTAEGNVTLALRPRRSAIATGDDFLVDIVYANPKGVDIDSMRVAVRFDPTVLQVVDYDEDNWITNGVNILDGPYHDELPFDFHMRNKAYNNTGLISYEMGFSQKVRVPSAGVLATIRFKAVSPAAQTDIVFDAEEGSRSATTTVSFLGFNLVGRPDDRAAALTNAAVRID